MKERPTYRQILDEEPDRASVATLKAINNLFDAYADQLHQPPFKDQPSCVDPGMAGFVFRKMLWRGMG